MSAFLDWAAAMGGPVGVVVGGAGMRWIDRHKTSVEVKKVEHEVPLIDAQAVQIITSTALALVAPLKKEIQDLTTRVDDVENRFGIAMRYIANLRTWIDQHVPDKSPPQPPVELGVWRLGDLTWNGDDYL